MAKKMFNKKLQLDAIKELLKISGAKQFLPGIFKEMHLDVYRAGQKTGKRATVEVLYVDQPTGTFVARSI